MRILLVDPPFQRFMGFKCDWFPLGLGYLAASLEERGHEVMLYNAEFHNRQRYLRSSELIDSFDPYLRGLRSEDHEVWKETAEIVRSFQPEAVGITAPSVKFSSARAVAAIAKRIDPKTVVIVGGPHVTNCPQESLLDENIDIVVQREGEATIVELIDALSDGGDPRGVAGIAYGTPENEVLINGSRPLIEDLDSLPFPARHRLLDRDRLEPESMGNMITSRGRPFTCAYCAAHTVWTHRVRYRSAEGIVEEMKQVHAAFGTVQFTFWDDCFTLNRGRVLQLCEELRREERDFRWTCNTRFDLLDDELIREMKLAGCNNIELGVESGSPRILEKIRKGETVEKMREVASLLNRHNMYWSAFFMIGFPFERPDDISQTLALMEKLKPCWCTFSIFTPYPGTELYEYALGLGLVPPELDWSEFGRQSPHNSFTVHMSPSEFSEIAKEVARKFDNYNRRPALLWKKALTRAPLYYHSPKALVGDSRKLLDWLGFQ